MRRRTPRPTPPHAPCEAQGCGKPVERKSGEALYDYIRRRFCSKRCQRSVWNNVAAQRSRAIFEEAERDHDPCVICGGAVLHTRHAEALTKYQGRATCGPVCAKAHHKNVSGRMPESTTERVPWPKAEPSSEPFDFSAQNINPKDGGYFQRLSRPAVHSYASSSASWAAI